MLEYRPYVIGIMHEEKSWSQWLIKIVEEIRVHGKQGMTIAVEIGTNRELYSDVWKIISLTAEHKGMKVIPLESDSLRKFTLKKVGGVPTKRLPKGLKLYLENLRDPSFVKKILKKKPDIIVTGYSHAADIKAAIPTATIKPIPKKAAKAYEEGMRFLKEHRAIYTLHLKAFRAQRKLRKIVRRLKRTRHK